MDRIFSLPTYTKETKYVTVEIVKCEHCEIPSETLETEFRTRFNFPGFKLEHKFFIPMEWNDELWWPEFQNYLAEDHSRLGLIYKYNIIQPSDISFILFDQIVPELVSLHSEIRRLYEARLPDPEM